MDYYYSKANEWYNKNILKVDNFEGMNIQHFDIFEPTLKALILRIFNCINDIVTYKNLQKPDSGFFLGVKLIEILNNNTDKVKDFQPYFDRLNIELEYHQTMLISKTYLNF